MFPPGSSSPDLQPGARTAEVSSQTIRVDLVLHSAALPHSSLGGENPLVHPGISRVTRFHARRGAEILVFEFGACAGRHRLCDGCVQFEQTEVLHEYVGIVMGLEMQPNIYAPKAIWTHDYPVTAATDGARIEPFARRRTAGDFEVDSRAERSCAEVDRRFRATPITRIRA